MPAMLYNSSKPWASPSPTPSPLTWLECAQERVCGCSGSVHDCDFWSPLGVCLAEKAETSLVCGCDGSGNS